MTRPSQGPLWDPADPKYKCCCDGLHVSTGAKVIAGVEAIGVVILIVMGFREATEGHFALGLGLLVTAFVVGAIVLTLVYGLHNSSPHFVLPHLVLQGIVAIGLGMGLIAICILIVKGGPEAEATEGLPSLNGTRSTASPASKAHRILQDAEATAWRNLSYGLLIGLFCGVGVEVWFFFVVYRAYGYFQDKDFARGLVLEEDLRPRPRPKPVDIVIAGFAYVLVTYVSVAFSSFLDRMDSLLNGTCWIRTKPYSMSRPAIITRCLDKINRNNIRQQMPGDI